VQLLLLLLRYNVIYHLSLQVSLIYLRRQRSLRMGPAARVAASAWASLQQERTATLAAC
jgi:hypothetical protein